MTAEALDRPRSQRSAGGRGAVVVAACLAVAVASLAVPATLGYDPWAWLVWGRELGRGALDTTGGPSWKPLPVAVTTILAPFGSVAVGAYAVLARTAALLAIVATARLGARLAGPAAAAVAAVALWLTPDGDPRFVRLVLEGHEAPWSAGLAVAALVALLDRRAGWALTWTWLLALLRPESWPFLLALVVWIWAPGLAARRGERWAGPDHPTPRLRRWAAGALASIPVLWFVPDWIGSGSPLHGAGTAQVLADEPTGTRLVEGITTAAGMVPLVAWALAAVAVLAGWRRRDVVPGALAAVALAWSVLVVAMAAVLGYAAISRFFLPAAALLVALAGAGAVDVATAVRRDRTDRARRVVVPASVLVVGVVLALPRVAGLPDVAEEVSDRGHVADALETVIDRAGGGEVLSRCGRALVTARTLLRSAAAWHLDLPLDVVERSAAAGPAVMLLESERATRIARDRPGTVELASADPWTAFAADCPAAARP